MPAIDHKPIVKDSDDKHHSKLIYMQDKNNSDTSPVFASLPIGSAVAVQWEDSRLWTHGKIINMGDHNHHDWAYIIQLTTNGRWITCNRQHIKPTSVTWLETYLQYHGTKQSQTWVDPLNDILKHINNNPTANAITDTNKNNIHSAQYSQQTDNSQKGRGMDNREQSSEITDNNYRQETVNIPKDKRTSPSNDKVIKTRSGQIVKKPDRLSYT